MDISIEPDLETLIEQKVRDGGYTSASDVVREALQLMEERDRLQDLRKDKTRSQISAGVASVRAGRTVDGEAVFDRLERELDAADERGPM